MTITFAGAAQEVTGSCYYIESKRGNFLVDCGLFQGGKFAEDKNQDPFPFDPKKVDFVILTHAHLDHCGRLPLLYQRGFTGKIYCTEPTSQLAMIVLLDAANLMRHAHEDEGRRPLYSESDVELVRHNFNRFGYHNSIEPKTGIKINFLDAGHILGSAIIEIFVENKILAFSGDLGNPPVHILRTTETPKEADLVVIESTYGDRYHESRAESEKILTNTIRSCIKENGVLLVPTFAIERTQEILYHLNALIEDSKMPKFPIFVDSPMAIRATEVFQKYPEFYSLEALKRIAQNDNLFDFPGLNLTMTKNESMMINGYPPPKMIIAGSGMMHGGRIQHHLKRYLPEKNTRLLIIGFLIEGSLGRRIFDGARRVKILGENVPIKARVTAIGGFSAHADQPKLLRWLEKFAKKPQEIIITHGEINQQLGLSETIESKLKFSCHIPKYADRYLI